MKKVLAILKSAAAKVSLATLTASASATVSLAAPISVGGETINPVGILRGSLSSLVSNIINLILVIAGVLAVIYLIWGGITYITAGGEAEKAGKGRTAITNAIIGIIIIAASLVIYNSVTNSVESGNIY